VVGGSAATWVRCTVGSTTDQAPSRCQDQGYDWQRRHAESGGAGRQRGANQASPRMGWNTVRWRDPLTGWAALVHLQAAIAGRDSTLVGWFFRCAPNAGCLSFYRRAILRGALAGRICALLDVEPCLKQSGSCGLLTRMATSLFWGLVARSWSWRSHKSVSSACLASSVSICRPGCTGSEKHHEATSQGLISNLIRRALDPGLAPD
jgi:hypothetical protein